MGYKFIGMNNLSVCIWSYKKGKYINIFLFFKGFSNYLKLVEKENLVIDYCIKWD